MRTAKRDSQSWCLARMQQFSHCQFLYPGARSGGSRFASECVFAAMRERERERERAPLLYSNRFLALLMSTNLKEILLMAWVSYVAALSMNGDAINCCCFALSPQTEYASTVVVDIISILLFPALFLLTTHDQIINLIDQCISELISGCR